MSDIELRSVPEHERSSFRDLLEEYLGEDGGRVFAAPKNPDGSYSYPYFDLYWQEPTRFPFYITGKDEILGFVMVRKLAEDICSIAEFYVRQHFRRAGIGRAAIKKVFEAFPEKSWLISVIRQNRSAYDFWINIGENSTVPIELEVIEKQRYRWPEVQ
ncbi:MAG: GNAT family N-acetyltransferase [Candidatus Kapaibacterium sp.]